MSFPLTAAMVEGFVERYLLDHYAERRPIPAFNRRWWEHVTSGDPRVAIAAPRSHAKTTSINFAYGLAAAVFKRHPFQLKISSTHKLAVESIRAAKDAVTGNAALRRDLGFKGFERDTEDDFIAVLANNYRFRMIAASSEQAIRGVIWGSMRPTLVIGDDLEGDEQVMNEDRRQKMMNWLLNVIMPIGNVDTEFRIIGTIMHSDSMLRNLLDNPAWKGYHYEGTNEDLSEFLWPEKYPKAWWEAKKLEYAGFHNLAGFNREYRNIAVDTSSGFFRPEDFPAMSEDEHKLRKTYYVGADLAYSQKQGRDFTVFVVGGIDEEGTLHIVDVRRGRWDGNQVIDEMYSIAAAWDPAEWFIEGGAIKATLGAALEMRMASEGFFNIAPGLIPTKDKAVRAVPIQARMRSRNVRFDTQTSWFATFEEELLQFSQEGTRGKHDDCVDAIAWLGQGLKRMVTPATEEEEDDWEFERTRREAMAFNYDGRSRITGY